MKWLWLLLILIGGPSYSGPYITVPVAFVQPKYHIKLIETTCEKRNPDQMVLLYPDISKITKYPCVKVESVTRVGWIVSYIWGNSIRQIDTTIRPGKTIKIEFK